MGVAKENRDRKHFREVFDRESAQHRPALDRAAEHENTISRNERLIGDLEYARAELAEAKQALKLEMADHEKTIERAEYAAQVASTSYGALMRSYSEVSQKLFNTRPLTKHEAMLLVCDDGSFTLVHPGAGGLGAFASLEEARRWATRHDGFIPQRADYHDFHGPYYRVGFNVWPGRL